MAVQDPPTDDLSPAILAERAILATMLISSEESLRAQRLLQPHSFFRIAHQRCFAALVRIATRGEQPGVVTLINELDRHHELPLVGGADAVFSLADVVGMPANLEAHAAIVRDAHARLQIRHLTLQAHEQSRDQTIDVHQITSQLEAQVQAVRATSSASEGPGRFAEASVSAAEFSALEIPPPRSLLGDGVLVAGGFGILYGRPSLGKSWLALSLAGALARGTPWFGIPTASEGVRVGVLQLELGDFRMQARLRSLGIGDHGRDGDLRVVCRPMLKGVVDLFRNPQDLEALRRWVSHAQLSVLMIDALSRAHTADENKAEELGQVLGYMDAIRHETGCAILLVHHEPKLQAGGDPMNHLDRLRGSSRLQSDPTLLMRVYESRGLRCLTFVKVSEGAEPADIYYRTTEDGTPEVMKSPESISEDNRDKILACILASDAPLTRGEIESRVGLTMPTVKRHLKALTENDQILVGGDYHRPTYSAPVGSSAQSAQYPERADASVNIDNRLSDSWE